MNERSIGGYMTTREKLQKVVDFLKYEVSAFEDTCGEDDDVCYKPAREALDFAKEVLSEISD